MKRIIIALVAIIGLGLVWMNQSNDVQSVSDTHYLMRPATDEVIYFMLPDRFNNGNPDNDRGGIDGNRLDHGFDPTHKGFYHGGDLVGLTEKLDYIQGMGVTAIWLGPIYKNKPVQGPEGDESAAYHGYWITDFTKPDPHLGTEEDLQAFIDAAHARNMKVYLDIITNHSADVINYRECHDPDWPDQEADASCPYRDKGNYPYTTRGGIHDEAINDGFLGDADELQTAENFAKLIRNDYAYTPFIPAGEETVKTPAWLNDPQYYHNRGNTSFEGEDSLYGDFSGLDDIFTEHPRVIAGMIDIFGGWIDKYRVDGFRIDTTRHVNSEFWRQFLPAMKARAQTHAIKDFYMFGEVYDFDPGALARFTHVDGFDQVLDFGFQSAIFDVISQKTDTNRLIKFFNADDIYRGGQAAARRQPTFLGNHDMGRFSGLLKSAMPDISQAELLARTKLAHALMFFMRGVPVIYSGDEQGFVSDGHDQLARESLFPSKVAVYNDNNLIGTDKTTADENFDRDHPLYLAISEYAEIRQAHKALRQGDSILRYSERNQPQADGTRDNSGRGFAFSRIDPDNGREYIIAVNTSNEPRHLNIAINATSETFTTLLGDCPARVTTTATISIKLPPLGIAVCHAN